MTDRCAVNGAGRCTPALGEPVLGPPGYTYRASARFNPIGRMTHDWWDSTHVAVEVVTVGLHNQRWKVETSAFHGREPDDIASIWILDHSTRLPPAYRFCQRNDWHCRCRARACATRGQTSRSPTRIRPPALRHLRSITCRWARPASGQPRWQLERIARENQPQAAFPRAMHLRDVHLVVHPLVNAGRSSKLRAPCAPCERPRVNTAQSSERSCRSSE
jgi:hypothetical protein